MFVIVACLVAGWVQTARAADGTFTLYAAASLRELVERSIDASAIETRSVFAASSTLARQIEAGAPADLFISAHPRWMDALEEGGLVDAGTRRDLFGNRLVVITRKDDALPLSEIGDLPERLGEGRLALGDPVHVPAGMYARAALSKAGIWQRVADRLAPASNVRAALAFVAQGEAPLGIVYASDARIEDDVAVIATIDDRFTPDIRYPAAVVADAAHADQARAFIDFLVSKDGQAIATSLGFTALLK
jgi:molybdate transport system substrate-binding protein